MEQFQNPYVEVRLSHIRCDHAQFRSRDLLRTFLDKHLPSAHIWTNPDEPFSWCVKQSYTTLDPNVTVIDTFARPSVFLPGFEDVLEFVAREKRALGKRPPKN